MASAKVHGELGPGGIPLSARRESLRGGSSHNNDLQFASLFQQRESYEEESKNFAFYENIRRRVKYYVFSTWYGMMYKRVLLFASITSVFLYIVETYFDKESNSEAYVLLSAIELVTAIMFGFDWSLSVYLAEHKLDTVLGFNAMIDLVTVLAVLFSNFIFTVKVDYPAISSVKDVFIYALYCCQTIRILRIIRLHKEFEAIEDKVNRFLAQITLAFVTMLLFDSALMQYLEGHVQQLDFHEWAYMMTVTMTTVGYGDILPYSTFGRFAIMAIIYFAIVFVPMQTNELIEMMSRQSVYARARYKPRGLAQHVIICGDLESTSLIEFFRELFHEDHENLNLHAVVLQPEPPSFEMREILLDPIFSLVVHYIEGSPLLDMDLGRAKAETAVAIFLLSNKFCLDADAEDTKIILQQLSIERFMLSYGTSTEVTFCMQLLRPQNKKHLGDIDESDNKLVVCLNQMKMGALAKACLFPGVNTLIFNLLSSFAEDEDPLAEASIVNKFDSEATEEDEIGTWLEEYEQGCGWEIYTTELSEAFEGQKFVDLAYTLYDKIGIVLFALRIKELKGRQHVRVLLNPAEFVIPKKDEYEIQGFVVATNKKQSDLRFAPEEEMSGSGPNPFQMFQSLAHFGAPVYSAADGASTGRRDSIASSGSGATDSRRNSNNLKKETSGRWQDIKADYDAHRETQVGNAQEIISKQEGEYIRDNYFVRRKPLNIEEVTIETAILEEIPNVNHHIIIIGTALSSLYDFIRPWRAKYVGRLRHIVILTPFDIHEAVWRRVSVFEGIYFVKGSALEENDLRRAGIFKAAQVVVLADASNRAGNATSNSSTALEDADAIFSYQLVKRLNDKAHVVVEIIHSSNVGYLDTTGGDSLVSAEDYKFTPQFAAGTLYTSSLLDTVLCQTFYNPQIVRVVDKLITGTDHKPEESLADATGKAGRKKKKKSAVNSRLFDGMGSSLHQILVPDDLGKRTYGELFKYLSQRRMIPLGLLRGTFPAMGIGPKGNRLPYVYTNPSKDTEVFSCDKVFVLSQKSLNTTKHTADEIHENFLRQTEAAIITRRAEIDSEVEMSTRPKSVMQKEMDRFFSSVSNEVKTLSSAIQELRGNTVKTAVSAFAGTGSKAYLARRRGAGRIKPPPLVTLTPKGSTKSLRLSNSGKSAVPGGPALVRRTDVSSGISHANARRPRSISTDTNGTTSSDET